MKRFAAVGQVLALLAAAAAHAQDPLHSPECGAARAVLEEAIRAAARKQPGAAGRLGVARRDAIEACLGRDPGEGQRAGAPDPVIAVPAPLVQAARGSAATVVVAAPPPLPVARPTVITTCDASGCWDSEGRRLNSVGPLLVGPRGLCTLQAGMAQCP